MNEDYNQQQFPLNKFKSRQKILTTRTKMRVLSSLNSDCMKLMYKDMDNNEKNSGDCVLNHHSHLLVFRLKEELYVKELNDLHEFLLHPMLRGGIICLDNLIKYVNELIAAHEILLHDLFANEDCLATFFLEILPHLMSYVKYHSEIDLELASFKKFCHYYEEQQWDYFHKLLLKPVKQISVYEKLFKDLSASAPEENKYKVILKEIQDTLADINEVSFTRKNSLRMLQIQKLLIDRQPKILALGRTLLKEGLLYKVNYSGKRPKPRMFFLFNDFLMCCKVIDKKKLDEKKEATLKCRSVIPLNLCSVHFVLGQPKGEGALFKVTYEKFSYLLLAKEPGESQCWVKELQTAIGHCQRNINVRYRVEQAKPLNLKRAFGIRKRCQPAVTKRSVSVQVSQTSIKSAQDEDLQKKNSGLNRIFAWFMCIR